MEKNLFAGIDVGSLSTDTVVINEDKDILLALVIPTGASIPRTLATVQDVLKDRFSKDETEIHFTATGYGRKRVGFAENHITEITAHALGAMHFCRETRTVIDMGGQDTKVIKISPEGRVQDFAMNDKCAAGTGRFLEVMARILEMDLEEMSNAALTGKKCIDITNTCTVFIESEIISLLSQGVEPADISGGVFHSIAGRIYSMAKSLNFCSPCVLTGGVAKNAAMINALKKFISPPLLIPEDPQIMGALGASIFSFHKIYNLP